MEARFVRIGEDLPKTSGTSYSAFIQNGGLALAEMSSEPGDYDNFNHPIQNLIEQVQDKEWKDALEDRLIAEIRESAEGDPNIEGLISQLEVGPWNFNRDPAELDDLLAKCRALDKHDRVRFSRSIAHAAQKILERKTVLLLPDWSDALSTDKSVFTKIAIELIRRLEDRKSVFDIAIVRVKRENSAAKKVNQRSFYQELMDALFLQTTQLEFGEGLHEKEGPLLIEGPTGTGKTLAARLLASKLEKELYEVNLAALSTGLLESRIRGYEKGTFTGAVSGTPGFFEEADGQVLFLDELQSASLESQTQLLDLLNAVSNTVRVSRMGDDKNRQSFNVKVVLATNRSTTELLGEGKLREDLFHRIRDVVHFKSLHELLQPPKASGRIHTLLTLYRWQSFSIRAADIPNLELEKLFTPIASGVEELIRNEQWPGNFRQFERFAHDLYWKLDHSSPFGITETLVRELLEREKQRFQPLNLTHNNTKKDEVSEEKRIAKFIETTLFHNDMVIEKSLKSFEPYKLKSRPSLKSFMQRNQNLFSSNFISDSKIQRFLQITTQPE